MGQDFRPQTQRDPTGGSPPLETDPRAVRCELHSLLLYPGERCGLCLDAALEEQFSLAPPDEQVFDEDHFTQ
jgi:hypothetical protein